MKKSIKKIGKTPHRIPALLFAAIFAGLGVYILAFTHAAAVGTITLSPASSTLSLGGNIAVTVLVNSGTTTVNTAEADLTFDQTKLQFVSVDSSTSSFDLAVEANGNNTNGTVQITKGDTTAGSGQQTLAIVNFKAIGVGNTAVGVGSSSLIFESATNTNILTGTTGATYTVNDTTAPTTPTGLAASGTTVTSTTLNWTASTDNVAVAGYNVYRGGTKIASTPTNSYTNTGLTPSTAYSYTVQAYDAAGNNSGQSTALAVNTPADTAAPTIPTGLTAPTVTGNSVTLNWTASTDNVGVTGYNIYRGGTKIATSATNSYTNTGLTSGTGYSYTVQAYDAAGNTSAQTSALAVTTTADTTPPSTPTGLTAPTKTNVSVNLSWAASTDNIGVAGYNIYRNGTKITTTTGTTFSNTGLTPGATYSYTVQAYDAAGNTSAQTTGLSVTLGIKLGDINADNVVDGSDFSLLALNFRKTSATRAMGDLSGDGVVDGADLSMLASGWGK